MSRFLDGRLASLEEYVPGEQPKDRRYIKLNTNESPYPPPENVIKALSRHEAESLRLYSDPENSVLKQRLAALYGVTHDNVLVSNGSDEALNFAFMAYGRDGVSFPDITYGFYGVFAALYGLKADVIPLNADFSVNASAFLGKGGLTVIANPNAPTGVALPLRVLEGIVASSKGVVLIDEAYVDFGAESAVGLVGKYDNVIVVRTFSKSRSMAGARLGYAFADGAVIRDLEKIRYSTNPYNINRLTQAVGAAALENQTYFDENCRRIIKTREHVTSELKKRGFALTDSRANFVFAESDRIGGEELYLKMKENGVLIRHFGNERIKNRNRITIGSEEEMQRFLEITDRILEGTK